MNDSDRDQDTRGVGGSADDGNDLYAAVEAALSDSGSEGAFDRLTGELEKQGKYQELFEVLVMRSRHELGMPLIQIGLATDVPDHLVEPHEEAIAAACRRVGGLFLESGDVGRAWPYLRAVGDTGVVRETIEKIEPGTRRKDVDTIIEIAINEGVYPSRGLETVVHHYGICSAITNFEQFNLTMRPAEQEACARVLMRALYDELLENIRAVVEEYGGAKPGDETLMQLIRSRPDLFEEDAYFIDSSHLWSVVRFCSYLNDPADLELAIELTEYGRRLSSMYQYESEPPFDDYYPDHQRYFEGVLANARGDREAARQAAEHFIAKGRKAIEDHVRHYPARAVLTVLKRMGCLDEAIDLALEFDATEGIGPCQQPSVYELCQLAGDYDRLTRIARERNEPVAFIAGVVQESSTREGAVGSADAGRA